MNQEKQPDAIELAARLETIAASDVNIFSSRLWMRKAATELQRLHALAETNRAELVAEAARTAEEKLRADQMTKQHRTQCDISKSAVATLVGLGYTDRGGEQWAPPIGKAPDFNLLDAAHARIADLEDQLSSIGAGGVEKLRKRECLHQIAEPDSREAQMLVIKRGADGVPTVWCDPEIADIVRALNGGGVPTIASCSGHVEKLGSVALSDGRVLMIFPSLEEFTAAHRQLHAPQAHKDEQA